MALLKKEIDKLATYWRESADHDWETADSLWQSKRYDACLFYCHLVMERLLKGLVVLKIRKHAPHIHDLVELLSRAEIDADKELVQSLAVFTSFNLRCRYSKDKLAFYKIADRKFTQPYFKESKFLIQWLKEQYPQKK